ncbi:MAG TPA: energy transducer TonB [Candidatus Dormibacteraeota bacterium]|nr:energy transducer TonB [Candidatus Dormibacteraeota bacterium]
MARILVSTLLLLLTVALADAQDTRQSPTDVPSVTAGNLLLKRVAPVYPPLARQARIQGTVMLRIVILKSGDVSNLQLVSGHPMLAPAAIEAVRQWKYRPYLVNGEPVEAETTVQVNFKLAGEPDPSAGDTPGGMLGGLLGGVATSGQRVPVAESVMRSLRIQKVDPVYPPIAIQEGIQGEVLFDVRINTSGSVEGVMLISGHPRLVPAAIEAVKHWKYGPYVMDGNAVAVATTVRLSFAISDGAGVVTEPTPSGIAPTGIRQGTLSMQPAQGGDAPHSGVPQRVRVSQGIMQGMLERKVSPQYPQDARDQHIQGMVVLHVNIDKAGNVNNVDLISGHPMLAPAAIEAVRQWRYRPYLLNGEAIEVDTQVQVNFTLAGE